MSVTRLGHVGQINLTDSYRDSLCEVAEMPKCRPSSFLLPHVTIVAQVYASIPRRTSRQRS